MSIIDKYIARTIINGTLLTLLVLVSLLAFIDFISEIADLGRGEYGLVDAMLYVLLSLPRRFYELFPTAVLLGSLLSLGALAGNSELTVMRAAGISIARIIFSVLQAGLVLVVLVAIIGELVVPASERSAQVLRASALKQTISLGGQHGFWARDGLRYMYVGRVYPDLNLGSLQIYELDESKQLHTITSAKSARYINKVWQLKNVQKTRFTVDGVKSEALSRDDWPELLNPDLFNIVSVQPENMSAYELYRYSDYLQVNELDASPYKLAFWIKVITPFSSLVMLLIAMPFVFSSQRAGTAGARVLVGLLIGIGFFLLNQTINHVGQIYGFSPVISATFPVLFVAILGMLALRRIK
ncbi:MAG: LPS export ABC transporter permease LptG [Gammaproteobacteria bacterium]|nr:LPS export ABC transporter permease LptG [Gammaproteobacteria bacterium]